ncbi:citrate synthase [Mesorhizobium sp. INR15]|uniref:citrate synthase n=1 Tax=Mesorhizobium sp. INR15 TaxID=2654248 RepID=UPI00189665E1|nr:citrate synthase [Mesorhizobium sp. INR15]QPC90438.1 citrate synthase [Mesorhizobium sp. INR15]
MSEWLSREEALERLKVRAQTLYAYVSRGRIGMRPEPADPRRSQYRAEDIAALATRRARGRRASAIAESAIAWGEPSIATSISTVLHGRLIYRGQDAVLLSDTISLEETAGILWTQPGSTAFSAPSSGKQQDGGRQRAFVDLAALAGQGQPSLGRSSKSLYADARQAVGVLATALGAAPGNAPLHLRLAQGWSANEPGADAIRRALVLLADHELNTSAFAARVAASTGASLASCLLAGLATLSGPRHGGAGEAVMQLAADAVMHGADATVRRWLDHDRPLPGFGHPLYSEGDVRAISLMQKIEVDGTLRSLGEAALAATGMRPNIDFALAALTRSLGLPLDAPFRLFALGRSIGWAAHAVEQAASGTLIRPRGRYEGLSP